jgi:predicted Fe-S protein YdhL (DUF1289 family)
MTPTPDDPAPSPCVRRCTLDEQDMCIGCGRMLGEIMEWAAAPLARKLEIKALAAERVEQRRRRWTS